MSVNRQGGYVSGMLISLIVVIVLLVGALSFGVWAFMGRQDYKNNSDKKAQAAATASKTATEEADAVKYAEAAKSPVKTYVGPSQFGAVTVQYPKTWSAYIIENSQGSQPVNNYFHPDTVPYIDNKANVYSLRIEVVSQSYDRVVDGYKNDVATGKVSASPYALPKVPNVIGTRIEGQLEQNIKGSMVILPLRNMTLKIWTESADYMPDFNNIILPNATFSP